METRAPYVAVGVFVVLLIAGLVVAVLWFAQVQFREQVSYYDIYFGGNVTGLTEGSTVRDNGVPVGRVAEIRLDPTDPSKVRVTVELTGGVLVKTDTVASLELQGLAGGVYINLSGSTRAAPDLREIKPGERYPVIASRRSGLEQVVISAPEVLSRMLDLADQLKTVLSSQNIEAFSETLQNVRKVSAVAAGRSADIDSALKNGAATLQDLHASLESVNGILAGLSQLVAPQGGMQETLRSFDDTSHRISDLAQHLDALVTANGPQVGALTQRSLSDVDELAVQTQALVQKLSHLADAVERDPSRFIYGDRREGYSPR